MKFTKEERLEIGQRIYESELNCFQASVIYDISVDSARNYMRLYRAANNLPPKGQQTAAYAEKSEEVSVQRKNTEAMIIECQTMTREQLIAELIREKQKK